MGNYSIEEHYVPNVWVHTKTAQVRWWIRWWHQFRSNMGNHLHPEQFFYLEENMPFHTGSKMVPNIPNSTVCHFCWTAPHKSIGTHRNDQWELQVRVWPRVTWWFKLFWPISVNELGDADIRQCSEVCTLLLEQSLTVLTHGKALFSDERAVYHSSVSWNVFWA